MAEEIKNDDNELTYIGEATYNHGNSKAEVWLDEDRGVLMIDDDEYDWEDVRDTVWQMSYRWLDDLIDERLDEDDYYVRRRPDYDEWISTYIDNAISEMDRIEIVSDYLSYVNGYSADLEEIKEGFFNFVGDEWEDALFNADQEEEYLKETLSEEEYRFHVGCKNIEWFDELDEDRLEVVKEVDHDTETVICGDERRIYDVGDLDSWYETLFRDTETGEYYLYQLGGARSCCGVKADDDGNTYESGRQVYVLTKEEADKWISEHDED